MTDTQPVPDIDARVRRIEARGAVADLIHRYALNIRTGRPGDCAALFTQDGAFEIRDTDPRTPQDYAVRARNIGREEVLAYVGKSADRPELKVIPMIRNILIEVDGDTAHSTCMMDSRTWPAGAEVIGEYHDSFRCEGGEWRFTKRIFTIFRKP